jgi:hypothetical protein
MSVLTVRSVATFLRDPWCSSMVRMDFEGWEKTTERWERSFVSLPRGPSTVTIRERMWILTVILDMD